MPQPTEWQRIGNQINAAIIFTRADTDYEGRQFWIATAEREDAGRFIVRADEKLTAFMELEIAIRAGGDLCLTSSSDFDKTRRR